MEVFTFVRAVTNEFDLSLPELLYPVRSENQPVKKTPFINLFFRTEGLTSRCNARRDLETVNPELSILPWIWVLRLCIADDRVRFGTSSEHWQEAPHRMSITRKTNHLVLPVAERK